MNCMGHVMKIIDSSRRWDKCRTMILEPVLIPWNLSEEITVRLVLHERRDIVLMHEARNRTGTSGHLDTK